MQIYDTTGPLRLWTERTGNPDQPAVLLIMGASAQGYTCPDPLVTRLVARGAQAIRYDHRDTGRSSIIDYDQHPYGLADLPADPDQLPPPSPRFLQHLADTADTPPGVQADLALFRVMNGDVLPFDEQAARTALERCWARATDPSAAAHHSRAGQRLTPDRLVPLSTITAPTTIIDGDQDPIYAPAHADAFAAAIPHARRHTVKGMGHVYFSPGLPEQLADLIAIDAP